MEAKHFFYPTLQGWNFSQGENMKIENVYSRWKQKFAEFIFKIQQGFFYIRRNEF
jgi:virulence-associated protein VapD